MTQKEFEQRVEMQVTSTEFDAINIVYLYSDVDKDEFCEMWARINRNRIKEYRTTQQEREAKEMQKNDLRAVYNRFMNATIEERGKGFYFFTEKELENIRKAGIKVQNRYGQNRTAWQIMCDTQDFIHGN